MIVGGPFGWVENQAGKPALAPPPPEVGAFLRLLLAFACVGCAAVLARERVIAAEMLPEAAHSSKVMGGRSLELLSNCSSDGTCVPGHTCRNLCARAGTFVHSDVLTPLERAKLLLYLGALVSEVSKQASKGMGWLGSSARCLAPRLRLAGGGGQLCTAEGKP